MLRLRSDRDLVAMCAGMGVPVKGKGPPPTRAELLEILCPLAEQIENRILGAPAGRLLGGVGRRTFAERLLDTMAFQSHVEDGDALVGGETLDEVAERAAHHVLENAGLPSVAGMTVIGAIQAAEAAAPGQNEPGALRNWLIGNRRPQSVAGQVLAVEAELVFVSRSGQEVKIVKKFFESVAGLLERGLEGFEDRAVEDFMEAEARRYEEFGLRFVRVGRRQFDLPQAAVQLEDVLMTAVPAGMARAALTQWDTVGVVNDRRGQCVIDYLRQEMLRWATAHGEGEQRMGLLQVVHTESQLRKEFASLGADLAKGISVRMICDWMRKFGVEATLYAVEPVQFRVFKRFGIRSVGQSHRSFAFVVMDGHLHPITSPAMKKLLREGSPVNNELEDKVRLVMRTDDFEFHETVEGVLASDAKVVRTNLDLEDVWREATESTGVVSDVIIPKGGRFWAFKHPLKAQVIATGEDWEARKAFCEWARGKWGDTEFRWQGQSVAQLTNAVRSITCGEIRPSSHCDTAFVDSMASVPVNQCLSAQPMGIEGLAMDHSRCYTTAANANPDPWLVFNVMDSVVRWDGEWRENAEYYCDERPLGGALEGLRWPAQTMTWRLAKWLVDTGALPLAAVTHTRVAGTLIANDVFQPLFRALADAEAATPSVPNSPGLGKLLGNKFIGLLNAVNQTRESVLVTKDRDETLAHYLRATRAKQIVDMTSADGDVTVMSFKTQTRNPTDDRPIWNQIVCQANLAVLQKITAVRRTVPTAQLVGVKTDAIYWLGVAEDDVVWDNWHREEWNPPRVTWCPRRDPQFPPERPWEEVPADRIDPTKGCLITGPGGSGKTELAVSICCASRLAYKCLAFTNAAVVNLKRRFAARGMPDAPCQTIDSFMGYNNSKFDESRRGLDFLVIDEVSMVHSTHMRQLTGVELPIVFVGDFNQLQPVERSVCIDPLHSQVFRAMAGFQRCELEFRPEFGRYDVRTQECLEYLLEHKRLPPWCADKTPGRTARNIVMTNALRKALVAPHLDYQPGQLVIADYDSLKFACLKDKGFFHSMFYRVVSCHEPSQPGRGRTLRMEGVEGTIDARHAQPANAVTCHKYQGADIDEPFTIHELDSLVTRLEHVYVAISRARRWEDVHFKYTERVFASQREESQQQMMFPLPVDPYTVRMEAGAPRAELWKEGDEPKLWAASQASLERAMSRFAGVEPENVEISGTTSSLGDCDRVIVQETLIENSSVMQISENKRRMRFTVKMPLREEIVREDGTVAVRMFVRSYRDEDREHQLRGIQEDAVRWLEREWGPTVSCKYVVAKVKGKCKWRVKCCVQRYKPRKPVTAPKLETQPQTIPEFGELAIWHPKDAVPSFESEVLGTPVVKWGRFRFATMERESLVQSLVSALQGSCRPGGEEPGEPGTDRSHRAAHLYEVLGRNTAINADIDWDITPEALELVPDEDGYDGGWDSFEVLTAVLEAANAVAADKGVRLGLDSWAVSDACTPAKVSFHVSLPREVLEEHVHQKRFWTEVADRLREDAPWTWFVKVRKDGKEVEQCPIDLGVYGRKRAMRTVLSEKEGKDNPLVPLVWDPEERAWVEIESPTRGDIVHRLLSAPDPAAYTVLGHREPEEKIKACTKQAWAGSRRSGTSSSTPSGPVPEGVRRELEGCRLPEGVGLRGSSFVGEGLVRLERHAPGDCPSCGGHHERDNGFAVSRGGVWHFRCYKPDARGVALELA